MDEQKKTLGRARIYTGDPEGRDPGQIPEGRRSRRAEPIGSLSNEHLAEPPGRRRRDEETDAKMRLLWVILFVLIAVLVAAIFYEIVLGYGSVETGAQRMENAAAQTEMVSGTEDDESEEQESEDETGSETASEDGQSVVTGSSGEDGQSTGTGSDGEDGQSSVAETDAEGEQEEETGAETQTEQESEASVQAEAVTDADAAAQTSEGTSVSDVSTLAGVGE